MFVAAFCSRSTATERSSSSLIGGDTLAGSFVLLPLSRYFAAFSNTVRKAAPTLMPDST